MEAGGALERGVATSSGDDAAVFDEALFVEDVDEEEEEEGPSAVQGVSAPPHVGVVTEEEVDVDESLFDVDNLQDLNLDDPTVLESPGCS